VGDRILPVPGKLAVRIRQGKYINMGKLLPEFWSRPKDDATKEAKPRQTRTMADI